MKLLSIMTTIVAAVVLVACRNGLTISSPEETAEQTEVTLAPAAVVEPGTAETSIQEATGVAETGAKISTSPVSTPSPVIQPTSGGGADPTTMMPVATLAVTATGTITPVVPSTPSPGGGVYAAEKISLAPANTHFDLAALAAQSAFSTQSAEPPPTNFAGWSNSGQQFTFAIPLPSRLTDPTAPEGSNAYTTAELWIANLDGTGLRKITEEAGSLTLWSPDDTQIVYSKKIGISKQELWIVDLQTGTQAKLNDPDGLSLNDTDTYGISIAWLNNNHLLYTTYSLAGKYPTIHRNLWLHNTQTKQIQEVQVDNGQSDSWVNIWLAPNKTLVIVTTTNNDLWLGQLTDENGQLKIDYTKPLIPEDSLIPYWSPDSTKVAIASYGRSANKLRIIDINSGNIVEIPFELEIAKVEWFPDSQAMVVSNFPSGNFPANDIYVVNADGSGQKLLSSSSRNNFQLSPDGQHIVLDPVTEDLSGNGLNIFKIEVN